MIALVALLVVTAVAVSGGVGGYQLLRGRERAYERREMAWTAERKMLLDRIMFLADRPWEAPPVDVEEYEEPIPDAYNPMEAPIASVDFDYYSNPSGVV